MSKCAGCDQHNAVIYHDDDMYCEDCYQEKLDIEDEEHLLSLDKSYEDAWAKRVKRGGMEI
jgi:Zn finger protein HypA/HybF involved in hydrogenase expression